MKKTMPHKKPFLWKWGILLVVAGLVLLCAAVVLEVLFVTKPFEFPLRAEVYMRQLPLWILSGITLFLVGIVAARGICGIIFVVIQLAKHHTQSQKEKA